MPVLMGLDFGQKRIGVAVTDETGRIALPLTTLERTSRRQLISDLTGLADEYRVAAIVVGLPKTMAGEVGIAAKKILEEVEALKGHFQQPWEMWDERLTSAEVERVLLDADLSRARRREVRDRLAAQRILQNYVDHRASIRPPEV